MIDNMVGPYKIIEKIGIGSMASVYKAIHCQSKKIFAIKTIILDGLDSKENEELINTANNEIDLMKTLDHHNIIKYIEMFQEAKSIHIVMEYANYGSLKNFDLILPMNRIKIYNIVNQIVDALDYLHNDKKVVHRDLKIENILLLNDQVKLCDFGLSKKGSSLMKTRCGSPAYAAPEIIKGMEYSEKVDIWSLGIILYLLSTGQLPFYDENINLLFHKIIGDDLDFRTIFDQDLKDLIEGMLQKEAGNRYTLFDIKNSEWMKKMSIVIQNIQNEEKSIVPLHGMTKSFNARIFVPCGMTIAQKKLANHRVRSPFLIPSVSSVKNVPDVFLSYQKKNNP